MEVLPNCNHYWNFPSLSTLTENRQLFDRQRAVPGSTSSSSDNWYPQQEFQVHRHSDSRILSSTHVNYIQTPDNLNSWNPHNIQMISDASSTEVDERHSNYTTSVPSESVYDLGRNGTHWSRYTTFNFRLPDSYPSGQPLPRAVGQDTRSICAPSHGHSNAFPYLNQVPLHYPIYSNNRTYPEPFPQHRVPLHHRFSSSSPYSVTRPDSRSHSAIYHPPCQGSTGLARHRRPTRAIEYNGLWFDEGELQQGLAEPNGNITVHQCHWEEDRSPCGLWVNGDKSCVNPHIQQWHGGRPGGDKLKSDCSWSGCGMVMQRQSIGRHVVTIHLGEVWKCRGCGTEIARKDAYGQHAERSNFEDCRTSGALITYSAGARVVNARAALDGGGGVRYPGT